jgi:hypothetical protein
MSTPDNIVIKSFSLGSSQTTTTNSAPAGQASTAASTSAASSALATATVASSPPNPTPSAAPTTTRAPSTAPAPADAKVLKRTEEILEREAAEKQISILENAFNSNQMDTLQLPKLNSAQFEPDFSFETKVEKFYSLEESPLAFALLAIESVARTASVDPKNPAHLAATLFLDCLALGPQLASLMYLQNYLRSVQPNAEIDSFEPSTTKAGSIPPDSLDTAHQLFGQSLLKQICHRIDWFLNIQRITNRPFNAEFCLKLIAADREWINTTNEFMKGTAAKIEKILAKNAAFQPSTLPSNLIELQKREKLWPHSPALLQEIKAAGFVFRPSMLKRDKCVCETCAVVVNGWRSWHNPWSFHNYAKHVPSFRPEITKLLQNSNSRVVSTLLTEAYKRKKTNQVATSAVAATAAAGTAVPSATSGTNPVRTTSATAAAPAPARATAAAPAPTMASVAAPAPARATTAAPTPAMATAAAPAPARATAAAPAPAMATAASPAPAMASVAAPAPARATAAAPAPAMATAASPAPARATTAAPLSAQSKSNSKDAPAIALKKYAKFYDDKGIEIQPDFNTLVGHYIFCVNRALAYSDDMQCRLNFLADMRLTKESEELMRTQIVQLMNLQGSALRIAIASCPCPPLKIDKIKLALKGDENFISIMDVLDEELRSDPYVKQRKSVQF